MHVNLHLICTHIELQDLYPSPNIICMIKLRRLRLAGHVACMGERRDTYRVFVGKPGGTRPLGSHGLRWYDNIKMDLQETRSGGVKAWTGLIWLRIGTGDRLLEMR